MQFAYVLSLLGLTALALAQDDAYSGPCGSYKKCLSICPNEDFFPLIDECSKGDDGEPECYVNFYCA